MNDWKRFELNVPWRNQTTGGEYRLTFADSSQLYSVLYP